LGYSLIVADMHLAFDVLLWPLAACPFGVADFVPSSRGESFFAEPSTNDLLGAAHPFGVANPIPSRR
jgi:hypothetical protein